MSHDACTHTHSLIDTLHVNIHYLLCDRFTGVDFPPKIVFKVFISTGGLGIKYLSGQKVIIPASEVNV